MVAHDRVEVLAVYTQPDRPAGRGRKRVGSSVKIRAVELNIPVYQPRTLDDPEVIIPLTALAPDLMVVTAYGLLLSPAILAIPRCGCVNVHGSLLPRWRGAAPVQRAIEAGDRVTGVSLMRMEAGLDSGPVYGQRTVTIGPHETGGTLQDQLAQVGGRLLTDYLEGILGQTVLAVAQDPKGITYAPKLSRDESWIRWDRPASEVAGRIRAFNPSPGATTWLRGDRLRLLMALEAPECHTEHPPGEVLAMDTQGIMVACAPGAIRITQLQKAGARILGAWDFCNGTRLEVGERLG